MAKIATTNKETNIAATMQPVLQDLRTSNVGDSTPVSSLPVSTNAIEISLGEQKLPVDVD